MTPSLKHLLITTATAAIISPFATAQEKPFLRGRYVEVTARDQPEFNAKPLRAGAFIITSSIGLSAEHTDNVFAVSDNADSDTAIHLTPRFEVHSDWTTHELSAGGWIDHREYLDFTEENTTDYSLFATGRIDVTRDVQVRVGADYGHLTEERYAAASFGASEPASFDKASVYTQALWSNDRFQLEGEIGASSDRYDQIVQRLRDNDTTYVNARLSYALSPDLAVFVQGRQAQLDYLEGNRDGDQTTIDAGVNFELAAPFRGEVAIGNFKDDRKNPLFGDVEGLNVRGNLKWFPSELTTFTFLANRGVIDPGLSASATAVNTAFGVRVDHELLRNLLLFGDVRQEANNYEGSTIDRKDDALSLSAGGAYKMNPNVHLEFLLSSRSQESSGADAGPDIDVNVISAGLRFFP
jgi:hypothetical protein